MLGSILGGLAGFGVNTLMKTAVNTLADGGMSKLTKIGTAIGVWAVSGVIGVVVEDEVNTRAERFKEAAQQTKRETKQRLTVIEGEGA